MPKRFTASGEPSKALPDALAPLTAQPHWLVWKFRKVKGKITKVPYQTHGAKASSTDPSTWIDYDAAARAASNYDGVGFALLNSKIAAFDIDDCRHADTGDIEPWALGLVDRAGSYAEITPSGTGLRILGYGTGPKVHRKLAVPNANGTTVEVYRQAERYITVTGNVYRDTPLVDIDEHIDAVMSELDVEKEIESSPKKKSSGNKKKLPQELRNMLYLQGERPADYVSRSELCWAFMNRCLRLGLDHDEIITACLDTAFSGKSIFEHVKQEGGRRYVATQIRKAIRKAPKGEDDLVLVRVSDVPFEPYDWIWKERIARKKLTMFAGMPDVNKSTLALDLTARITKGGVLPDGQRAPLGNVIILSAEDDVADTLRPRLEVAGADLDRCTVIKASKDKGKQRNFDLSTDIDRLRRAIETVGDVVLVIIDPVSAYMGKPGKLDSYRSTDVRGILAPLMQMAADTRVAVVGIDHLSKSGSSQALLRLLGSVAFAAAPRAVYIIARDEEDKDRRLFLPAKTNIGKIRTGLSFRIKEKLYGDGPTFGSYPMIEWENGDVTMTADEALDQKPDGRRSKGAEAAKALILTMLKEKPRLQKEIEEQASKHSISDQSLKTAKKALSVTSTKEQGVGGRWWWSLPGQEAML